jgi:hypothetical protein
VAARMGACLYIQYCGGTPGSMWRHVWVPACIYSTVVAHLKESCIDGRIILKCVIEKGDGRVQIVFVFVYLSQDRDKCGLL